jgi:hypothetical protein
MAGGIYSKNHAASRAFEQLTPRLDHSSLPATLHWPSHSLLLLRACTGCSRLVLNAFFETAPNKVSLCQDYLCLALTDAALLSPFHRTRKCTGLGLLTLYRKVCRVERL